MSNDLDELTKLNKDYVDSVQNCDVRRFDEILAQDFYCTNPDKSLVDRAAFLKQTAMPVKIKGLKAEDVKIRILGDSPSSTRRPATSARTDNPRTAATPIVGPGRTASGSRYPRMWRGDSFFTSPRKERGEVKASSIEHDDAA